MVNAVGCFTKAEADLAKSLDAAIGRIGEQVQDIAFLLSRAHGAGRMEFGAERDTGASANSIVAIAYGLVQLDEQVFPEDRDDLNACCRAFEKLPMHRKTRDVDQAMFRAHQFIGVKEREFSAGGLQ